MEIKTSNKTDKSLSQIFDVNPNTGEIVDYVQQPVKRDPIAPSKALDDDFEIAREMMHSLLLKGANSLDNALLVANGTEDPKAFESVSKLMSNLTEISERLIGLHSRKIKAAPVTGPVVPPIAEANNMTITGPVFCGTTSELALMLKQQTINK